jgi:hypothetical protein
MKLDPFLTKGGIEHPSGAEVHVKSRFGKLPEMSRAWRVELTLNPVLQQRRNSGGHRATFGGHLLKS